MSGRSERFPPAVAEALHGGGWRPGQRDETRAREWSLLLSAYVSPGGQRHAIVPPALDAFAEFGGVRVTATGEGEQVAPSTFHLDPRLVLHSVATLGALGTALGTPLTPLGDEADGTGILAIDANGRVFVLDHSGDWFLGDSLDAALTALVLGLAPARLHEDGTW